MRNKRSGSKKKRSPISDYLFLIDQSFNTRAWHGTNLRGSLRGLSARQASRRPGAKRHNIWEVAMHCAYWKYIVRRRILGEKKGSFPLKGSNWFPSPMKLTEQEWRRDLKLLDACHARLRVAVRQLKPEDLASRAKGSKVSNSVILAGIASHDVYHAGQIQLLKRFLQ